MSFYHFGIIGDVHNRIFEYEEIAKECNYSLQLGDLAFDYSPITLDPKLHKFLPGNHDNYGVEAICCADPKRLVENGGNVTRDGKNMWKYKNLPPHFIGHFGTWTVPNVSNPSFNPELFFVRGAQSVDDKRRSLGIDLFEFEELNYSELSAAIELYREKKPDIVVSHTCPLSFVSEMYLPHSQGQVIKCKTTQALDAMLAIHRPKMWIFGHFHQSVNKTIDGTKFICLNIMEALYLNESLDVVYQI